MTHTGNTKDSDGRRDSDGMMGTDGMMGAGQSHDPRWLLPWGASPVSAGRVGFKVWAPRCSAVDVVFPIKGMVVPLQRIESRGNMRSGQPPHPRGTFAAIIDNVQVGDAYMYRLDQRVERPDPRSQFQIDGVHGPSLVVDHVTYAWSDQNWTGRPRSELVIYEVHVGCASPEGTYAGLLRQLPRLQHLGITAIELLPVAETPGRWNWGYDGVHLFAPKAAYGTPDELKRLVDGCHAAGLAVLLDVVYNHLGPEGNYLREFAPYFSKRTKTPWGEALNFSGRQRNPVRQWILDNVKHWIEDYHLDGLRLDAIHYLHDDSQPSITQEIAQFFHTLPSASRRQLHLIAETNVFDPTIVAAPLPSGKVEAESYSAQWADCLMHAIYSMGTPEVKLTNRDYRGAADIEFALRQGFVYQGNSPGNYARTVGVSPAPVHSGLVVSLQTHDSVGNHPHGKRLHQLVDSDFQKAAAGLVLLAPSIPQIFMGEEGGVESPFRFFTDFGDAHLRAAVDRGRQHEYPHHQWVGAIPPSDPTAFSSSQLPDVATWDQTMIQWYQQLLSIRQQGLSEGWLNAHLARWYADVQEGYFRVDYGSQNVRCRVESWLRPLAGGRASPKQPSGIADRDHASAIEKCELLISSAGPDLQYPGSLYSSAQSTSLCLVKLFAC